MKTLVILIHGIRTHAEWQEKIPEWLDLGDDVIVRPIGYGRLDVLKFLSPIGTRQKPIDVLTAEIDDLVAKYPAPNWRRVVIAHSFGTFAISKILEARPSLEFDDLLLCGSIVSEHYNWISISKQIKNTILNDCGRMDIWPIFARSVTWGYGATGTYGIQSGTVDNRFHSFAHSDFFNRDFVHKYWRPFVRNSEIVPSHEGTGIVRSPWYFQLLRPRLRLIIPLLLLLLLLPDAQKNMFRETVSSIYISAYEGALGPYISDFAKEKHVQADRYYFELNDNNSAAKLYAEGAKLGNPMSQASLAKLTYLGLGGVKLNKANGVQLASEVIDDLTSLAEEVPSAAYNLSFLYSRGIGVAQDEEEENRLLKLAASAGHIGALYNLGAKHSNKSFPDFNLVRAFEYFIESAAGNHDLAQLQVGKYYKAGFGVDKNYDQALPYLEKAEALGFAEAAENLGSIYWDKNWDAHNRKLAISYFEEAAMSGNAIAQTKLGYYFWKGLEVEVRIDQAIKWLEMAAAQDHGEAYGYLGTIYQGGGNASAFVDKNKALELFERGAKLGDQLSHRRLSQIYFEGNNVEVNFEVALFHSLACKERYTGCAHNAAMIFRDGLGLPKNVQKSIELLRRSADRGNGASAGNLGNLLKEQAKKAMVDGRKWQAEKYGQEAIKYMALSVELLPDHSQVQYNYGRVFSFGLPGVPKNPETATQVYFKAADLGHPDAQNDLGFRLLTQIGTKFLILSDSERVSMGKKYLLAAARGGNVNALKNITAFATRNESILKKYFPGGGLSKVFDAFADVDLAALEKEGLIGAKARTGVNGCSDNSLGLRYYRGDNAPQDFLVAQELFEQAANRGSPAAMYNLGRMHLRKETSPPDRELGLNLLDKAINLSFPRAALFLAESYLLGEYLEKNEEKAFYFLSVAKKLGEKIDLGALATAKKMYDLLPTFKTGASPCSK